VASLVNRQWEAIARDRRSSAAARRQRNRVPVLSNGAKHHIAQLLKAGGAATTADPKVHNLLMSNNELDPGRTAEKAKAVKRWNDANDAYDKAYASDPTTKDDRDKVRADLDAADDNMREVWKKRPAK